MIFWLILIVGISSAAITAAMGLWLIPKLRRLKFGQTILDIGPKWHKAKKEGTPTMGGLMFYIGVTLAFAGGCVFLFLNKTTAFEGVRAADAIKSVSALIMALCFGFVGFVDDYIKVKKKRNEGLTVIQKIVMQVLIIAAFFTSRVLSGDGSTVIRFPFLGQLDLSFFYYIFMGLVYCIWLMRSILQTE